MVIETGVRTNERKVSKSKLLDRTEVLESGVEVHSTWRGLMCCNYV